MTELSDQVREQLPPGIYETLMVYESATKLDKDDLLQNILAKMNFNDAVSDIGMNYALANTVPNTWSGNLSRTFGDDNKKLEYMLHEYLHNLHPEKSEIAIRAETARILHQYGADLGSHGRYLVFSYDNSFN